MDLEKFRERPLLGILRGMGPSALEPVFETAIASGLRAIEITMNTEGAVSLIRKAVRGFGGRIMIGAGTVLTIAELRQALKAGATFIVSPVVVPEVVRYCVRSKIPVFPGALVPAQVYEAWQAGATMVKLFPSGCFGPAYFKELKGPFPQIRLLACGGVTPGNARAYFQNGAEAIAVGTRIFNPAWIRSRQFHKIGAMIQSYLKALPSKRSQP